MRSHSSKRRPRKGPGSTSRARRERAERKQIEYERRRAEFIAANPTPYEDWGRFADHHRERVCKALGATPAGTWRQDRARPLHVLTVDDLAAALYGVSVNDGKGFHYGQLRVCYQRCGIPYHRQKAAAVIRELQRLDLVVLVGRYSTGKKGNVFSVVQNAFEMCGETFRPSRPQPVRRVLPKLQFPSPAMPAAADDDPFA